MKKTATAALSAAALLGSTPGASAFWGDRGSSTHDRRVDDMIGQAGIDAENVNREIQKRLLREGQKKQFSATVRHIKDMDDIRRTLAGSYIDSSLPIPTRLQVGDIVNFKGTDKRPGPWKDELQLLPGSEVEIIDVIPQKIGFPQYMVVNTRPPMLDDGTMTEGPTGKPIRVNHNQLFKADFGRTTYGLLEDWDKLGKDIMQSRYDPTYTKGAYLPGATTMRDVDQLVLDNPDVIVGEAFADKYRNKHDIMGKTRKKLQSAERSARKAIKTLKRVEKQSNRGVLQKVVDKIATKTGEGPAALAATAALATGITVNAPITFGLLFADGIIGDNARKELLGDAQKKVWKEDANRFLNEAEMRKLYNGIHNIERGKTSVYPTRKFETLAKKTLHKKHVKDMLKADDERKNKELKKLAEELDREIEEDADEAVVEPEHILVNDDVPEQELYDKMEKIISNYEDEDEDDEDEIVIDGELPVEPLRRQLQTKINDHNRKNIISGVFAKSEGASGRRRTRTRKPRRSIVRRLNPLRSKHSRKKRRKMTKKHK